MVPQIIALGRREYHNVNIQGVLAEVDKKPTAGKLISFFFIYHDILLSENSINALRVAYFLLVDTKTSPDDKLLVQRFSVKVQHLCITFYEFGNFSGCSNSWRIFCQSPVPSTLILVQSSIVQKYTTCFIVVDRCVLCSCRQHEVVPVLMAAFYVFNIKYTEGCTNLFFLLERILLEKSPPGGKSLVKLGHVLSPLYPASESLLYLYCCFWFA